MCVVSGVRVARVPVAEMNISGARNRWARHAGLISQAFRRMSSATGWAGRKVWCGQVSSTLQYLLATSRQTLVAGRLPPRHLWVFVCRGVMSATPAPMLHAPCSMPHGPMPHAALLLAPCTLRLAPGSWLLLAPGSIGTSMPPNAPISTATSLHLPRSPSLRLVGAFFAFRPVR